MRRVSHVGGGVYNQARGTYSVIAGGGGFSAEDSNSTNFDHATIGGGRGNRVGGNYGTVSGGELGNAGPSAFVGSGYANSATSYYSAIAADMVTTQVEISGIVGGFSNRQHELLVGPQIMQQARVQPLVAEQTMMRVGKRL
ncbi:MAG: hypothetical protein IPP40_14295 [bacterium]|nr:hypothetical protein [bacterium]